eukprot:TRINITY_DN175_c1_g1_i2.p2 TRINITY_DN175_c1_g1~~TRINITY_DN175_c1_g1_i2.p2  ORF type:complete len:152 (-),score=20.41 TRINITY_DN175_c1_g1_i2:743-1198(-)
MRALFWTQFLNRTNCRKIRKGEKKRKNGRKGGGSSEINSFGKKKKRKKKEKKKVKTLVPPTPTKLGSLQTALQNGEERKQGGKRTNFGLTTVAATDIVRRKENIKKKKGTTHVSISTSAASSRWRRRMLRGRVILTKHSPLLKKTKTKIKQ